MLSERAYQTRLVNKIKFLFPDCFVQVNDPSVTQGLPDLLILFSGGGWAMLEVKRSASEPERPNQPYYINLFCQMSFAAFIFPENEDEVLHDLQLTFGG